jgi:hypothetical protein
MIWISGPVIAGLELRTRKSAHEHIRRGSYGEAREVSGVLYVALPGVEARKGRKVAPEQLALAADGKPGRILTLPHESETA